MQTRALKLAAVAAAVTTAAVDRPPPPSAPLPRQPARVATALTETNAALDAAVKKWRRTRGAAPEDVVLYALYQQRLYRVLARNGALARATLARLTGNDARGARDFVSAHRGLYRLTPPLAAPRIKVGPAPAPELLLSYYRKAQRRFRVSWNVLAAVHFVESKFGKLRSTSAAGAQGPMQFMPATWRAYGMGGDINDPHDAILGAANYLRASGAPRDLRTALYHYNHSTAYVDAVLRYARRIAADRTTFFELYCWQVFVKTPSGDRRVTGPGLP